MIILTALTALLISLLLPSLSHSRKASYAIKCQSNLRQIGLMHLTRDRWTGSIYDISNSELSHPSGNHGSDKKSPIRVEPFDGVFGGLFDRADAKPVPELQNVSKPEPTAWPLPCPVAEKAEINSYGIRERMIGLPTHISASVAPDDVIFGCSDDEVVGRPGLFAERHLSKVSFFFADCHIRQMSVLDAFGSAKGSDLSGSKSADR
ncbi:MAG: hypothetical protein D8M59_12415 [Planctomycetes bacterium]|nr:hypothetical protein [Planctomycetota bacterium]